MLFMDDTLDEEDVLMISYELKVQNSLLVKTVLFLKISLSTSGRQRGFLLRYRSQTIARADYNQASKLVLVFVLLL